MAHPKHRVSKPVETKEEHITKLHQQHWQLVQIVVQLLNTILYVQNVDITEVSWQSKKTLPFNNYVIMIRRILFF